MIEGRLPSGLPTERVAQLAERQRPSSTPGHARCGKDIGLNEHDVEARSRCSSWSRPLQAGAFRIVLGDAALAAQLPSSPRVTSGERAVERQLEGGRPFEVNVPTKGTT